MTTDTSTAPVALVTGSAQRIGATIVRTLHAAGYNTVIHCRRSQAAATALASELNRQRHGSAVVAQCDLNDTGASGFLAQQAELAWGRLDALINSASAFYPTPLGETTPAQWDDLIGSNMKAPFFLAQALAPALRAVRGAIINITDIHADRPLARHTVYCMAKAANAMLTRSLALELAPHVRVNGIAPGAILWPEQGGATAAAAQQSVLAKVPLGRTGTPQDIANTALFLLREGAYINGQIIAVDGGRNIVG